MMFFGTTVPIHPVFTVYLASLRVKNLREPNFCGKKHHLAPSHTFSERLIKILVFFQLFFYTYCRVKMRYFVYYLGNKDDDRRC